jgi:hypothetical protein
MRRMESKVSVGDTLRETFAIYRDHAGVLLPVAFWLFLFAGAVEELTPLIVGLVGLAVGTLYQGMVVGLVREARTGHRDFSIRELAGSALPVFWRLLGAGLLVAIGLVGGFLLLIVPGLYLLAIWAVVAPAIVVERRRVTEALGRSRQLVRGNGWPVLGAALTGILLGAVLSFGLTLLAKAIVDGEVIELVLRVLGQAVAAPISALVASVLYFRLIEIERHRRAPEPDADLPPRLPA